VHDIPIDGLLASPRGEESATLGASADGVSAIASLDGIMWVDGPEVHCKNAYFLVMLGPKIPQCACFLLTLKLETGKPFKPNGKSMQKLF
jgi:hypothetical protein